MKTLRILSLLIVAALMFSCEKDMKDEVKTGEVSFGISHLDPMSTKNDPFTADPECREDDMVPVKAFIKIEGIIDPFTPDVFYLNNELYTQAIRFKVNDKDNGDTYKITEFLLLNADGNPIMATPKKNSDFAVFLTNPEENALDLEFTVKAFEKTEKKIEVLCYMEHTFTYFGYNWFLIDEIIVREMCFFGDLCHKDPDFFLGTIYDDVFDLDAHNYPFDLPALFEVRVSKGSQTWVYQNFDENDNFIAPLCVKYPDLLKVKNEIFTFELWVYVPVGDDVELVLFDTWVLTEVDGELDWSDYINEFDVVEFVIGNCNYNVSDVNFYPPWQNLPEYLTADITQDWNPGYWSFTDVVHFPAIVDPEKSYDLPLGDFSGWCADGITTINPNTDWTFYLFSSMYEDDWPSAVKSSLRFTKEKMASLNWLFNNLSDFGLPALTGQYIVPGTTLFSVQQAKILQDAIWSIIHWTGNGFESGIPWATSGADRTFAQNMAATARGVTEYYPLPGGYAGILFVPNDGLVANKNDLELAPQMIITIIDP